MATCLFICVYTKNTTVGYCERICIDTSFVSFVNLWETRGLRMALTRWLRMALTRWIYHPWVGKNVKIGRGWTKTLNQNVGRLVPVVGALQMNSSRVYVGKICMGQTVRPSGDFGGFFDPTIGRPDGPAHTKKLWDWMAGLVIRARQIGRRHQPPHPHPHLPIPSIKKSSPSFFLTKLPRHGGFCCATNSTTTMVVVTT
jgi:hypothetical protein